MLGEYPSAMLNVRAGGTYDRGDTERGVPSGDSRVKRGKDTDGMKLGSD